MIDWVKLKSILKPQCSDCNVASRIGNKTQCNNCSFVVGSYVTDGPEKTRRFRPAPGKLFKECNIPNISKLGKPQIMYFLYHQELNFEYPPLPDVDIFGNKKEDYKRWRWEIHHENCDPNDDTPWNIMLTVNTEHKILESMRQNEDKKYMKILKTYF